MAFSVGRNDLNLAGLFAASIGLKQLATDNPELLCGHFGYRVFRWRCGVISLRTRLGQRDLSITMRGRGCEADRADILAIRRDVFRETYKVSEVSLILDFALQLLDLAFVQKFNTVHEVINHVTSEVYPWKVELPGTSKAERYGKTRSTRHGDVEFEFLR